ALHQKVAKAIDHQRIGLGNNGLYDVVLLLRRPDLEFLLQEYGCLLIIIADDLVDDVLPVASDITVEQAAVVERLCRRRHVGLTVDSQSLEVKGQKQLAG